MRSRLGCSRPGVSAVQAGLEVSVGSDTELRAPGVLGDR